MGQRGPQRHSRAKLEMRGSWRARRAPAPALVAPASSPSPGQHLSAPAKREWDRLAPLLIHSGILSELDKQALACYCEAYAMWVAARDEIEARGLFYASVSGDQKPHPAVAMIDRAGAHMRSWG